MPHEFQPVPLPRDAQAPTPEKPGGGRFRFQRSTLTLIGAFLGPLLIGGVLAEIFHTGQVFSSAASVYSAEADRATKEGLDYLTREIAEGIKQAAITLARSKAESEQKVKTAEVEADLTRTTGGSDIYSMLVIGHGVNKDVRSGRVRSYPALFERLEHTLKDLPHSKTLGVGMRVVDPYRGFSGRRVFPIPTTLGREDLDKICAFECIQFDWNVSRCEDEWGRSLERPERNFIDESPKEWQLKLSEVQRARLSVYRQSLRDLEAVLFRKALDLERFKRMNPIRAEGEARWVNSELARLYRGLQNARNQINAVGEIEFLASQGQRSAVAAAYHGRDFLHFAFASESKGEETEKAILTWIEKEVQSRARLVSQDVVDEHARAFSLRFFLIRPVLANIWFLLQSDQIFPGQLFNGAESEQRAAASFEKVEVKSPGWSVPSWIALLAGFIGMLAGGYAVYRVGGKVSFVLCGIVCGGSTVVMVNSALQYNRFTQEVGQSITNGVISNVEAYSFTKRASESRTEIEAAASRSGSNQLADAEVTASFIKAQPHKVINAFKQRGTCGGMSVADIIELAEHVEFWIASEGTAFEASPTAREDLEHTLHMLAPLRQFSRPGPVELPMWLPNKGK